MFVCPFYIGIWVCGSVRWLTVSVIARLAGNTADVSKGFNPPKSTEILLLRRTVWLIIRRFFISLEDFRPGDYPVREYFNFNY